MWQSLIGLITCALESVAFIGAKCLSNKFFVGNIVSHVAVSSKFWAVVDQNVS